MQIVCEKNDSRKIFDIDKSEVVIGRRDKQSTADLQLDFDQSISRRHLRIRETASGIEIEDLGSSWGTQVNGAKITGPSQISPTDKIRIGDTELRISPEPDSQAHWFKLSRPVGKSVPIEFSDDELPEGVKVRGELLPSDTDLVLTGETKKLSRKQMALLLELPEIFAKEESTDAVAERVMEKALELLPAAGNGAVLVRVRNTDKFSFAASKPKDDPRVSQTLVERCVATRAGMIWSREAEQDPSESMHRLGLESGIYAPLTWMDQMVGVICMDHNGSGPMFSEDDLSFLMTVANYAGAAISNLMIREDLQRSLDVSRQLMKSVTNQIGKK